MQTIYGTEVPDGSVLLCIVQGDHEIVDLLDSEGLLIPSSNIHKEEDGYETRYWKLKD